MPRPTVQDPDAKPQQPDAEAGIGLAAGIRPGRATVHQHRERQTIDAEGFFPSSRRTVWPCSLLHAESTMLLTRVIVERGERMATLAAMHSQSDL